MTEQLLNTESLADQIFSSIEFISEDIIKETEIDINQINSLCELIKSFRLINTRKHFTNKINTTLLELISKLNNQIEEGNHSPDIVSAIARIIPTFNYYEAKTITKEKDIEKAPMFPVFFDA